jgi:two-component system, OmpR family, phosphate regulon response regulator PhoB
MNTILCVDDHTPTVQSLCLILQFAGYKCFIAQTAEDATRVFTDNNVDLVIVDHGLGDITGIELAARLKSLKSTRVLMLTGNSAIETTPPSVDLLVLKPYPPKDLLESVHNLLTPRAKAVGE